MGSGQSGLYSYHYEERRAETASEPQLSKRETKPQLIVAPFAPRISSIKERFTLNEHGNFGKQGKGKGVRVINSKNPVEDARFLFDELSVGGVSKPLPNGKGRKTEFSDGITVVIREITSTPESPAVEIRRSLLDGISDQKIHFIKE